MIKDHTPADTGILVHLGGVETPQGKVIIRHVLSKPANPSMDLSTITTFLQFCTKCHDLDLALNVWSWCKPVRDQTKDERGLMIITLVFLLFCGRIDLNLGRSVWNEIKALKLHHYPQLVGAMLSVLASHRASGEADEIIAQLTLGKMMNEKMLSSLLCSYSHVGRGEEAWLLLQRIKSETPDVVNLFSYNAVIDALARSGKFDRAFEIADCAKKAGFTPDLITWMSILSPCRARSDLSNAVKAFNYIKNLQSPGDHLAAAYVVMADVYRASGNEQAARLLHRERLDRKLFKQRGAVKMTMGGKSYEFHVAQIPKDLLHLAEAVELKLEEWTLYLESQGASTESIQCRHSENMALACAVVSGLKVVVLRKNLRICSSCHIASLLITVLEGIEIHHWDNSVVHKMKNGLCSCCSYY
jgi:pentatricopeptide repeat protein